MQVAWWRQRRVPREEERLSGREQFHETLPCSTSSRLWYGDAAKECFGQVAQTNVEVARSSRSS